MALERLQKILAQHGLASRRGAEEMIREGRVRVNGAVVSTLGAKADPEKDHIKVDGRLIGAAAGRRRVYLLYKPRGVMSTLSDPHGRPCIGDLVRRLPARLFHVGRLDTNTEGLILLTNDGDLSNRVMHPSYGCVKVYDVRVRGTPAARDLEKLAAGITVDGTKTAPCMLELRQEGKNSWLRVELREGRTHQIKKMFDRIGHPVSKIKRIRLGPLTARGLGPGMYRELGPEEVDLLLKSTSLPQNGSRTEKRGGPVKLKAVGGPEKGKGTR